MPPLSLRALGNSLTLVLIEPPTRVRGGVPPLKQTEIYTTELPLVYIASSFGEFFKLIYGIVIIFAIYSTMISAGYGFLQNCSKNKKIYKILAIIMCASAIITLFFSFSGLVNLTYPVFGILGFLQLLLMKKSNKGDGAFVPLFQKKY